MRCCVLGFAQLRQQTSDLEKPYHRRLLLNCCCWNLKMPEWLLKTLSNLPCVVQSLLQTCPSTASKKDVDDEVPLHVFHRARALDVFRLLLQKCPSAASKMTTKGMIPLHVAMAFN